MLEGGRSKKAVRKSARKSAKKSKPRKGSIKGVGKYPPGYKGAIKIGDKLDFYWPQHDPVTTAVKSIKKTKNDRFLAIGQSSTGAKLHQFVSGIEQ